MKQCCVIVIVIDDIFDSVVSPVVRLAVDVARPKTSTGDPHAEPVGVVITSNLVSSGVILHDREPSHFTAPVNDGVVEQSTLFKIFDECGRRPINFSASCG